MTESDLTREVTKPTEDEVLHLQLSPALRLLALDLLTDFPHDVGREHPGTFAEFEDNFQGVLGHRHVVMVLLSLNTWTEQRFQLLQL